MGIVAIKRLNSATDNHLNLWFFIWELSEVTIVAGHYDYSIDKIFRVVQASCRYSFIC